MPLRVSALVLAAMTVLGCAYPIRSTPLLEVQHPPSDLEGPIGVWRLTLKSAEVPPTKRDGSAWDPGEEGEDEEAPDVFVRIVRSGSTLWQSETVLDSRTPSWNVDVEGNVTLSRSQPLRIELYDEDGLDSEIIGMWTNSGLPLSTQPGVSTRVLLEGGGYVEFQIDTPNPHRGLGIESYELRPSALHVREVLPSSPAQRAGILAGDRIIQIDTTLIADVDDRRAQTLLSGVGASGGNIVVERGEQSEVVTLEIEAGGYVWVTR